MFLYNVTIKRIYMDTLKLTDDEWVAKYGEGNGYHEAFETLIQEERKDAVEGFAYYLLKRRNKDEFCGLSDGEVEMAMIVAKEYLESDGK